MSAKFYLKIQTIQNRLYSSVGSMIKMEHVDMNKGISNEAKNDQKTLQEFLQAPVHKMIQMRRSQMQIIDILAQSTKCQHSSFQAKNNLFKQMMINFLQMNQKLQQVIFETFDKDLVNEAKKEKQFKNANKQENNDKQIKQVRNDDIKEKKKKNERKFKEPTKKEICPINSKPQLYKQKQNLQVMKKKRNRMRTQQQRSESQNGSEQENKQRVQKLYKINSRNSRQKDWDTMSVMSDNRSITSTRTVSDFYMTQRRVNITLQEKIQWAENLIDNKRPIPHLYANFGELLLLPYSILQKLIDYNQSAEYTMGK